jgi:hypothetical protein
MSPGARKLALLDVHRLAAGRHRVDEIGLAAQEGRGLQHVDHRGHGRDLLDRVHVGQHRQAELLLDRLEHLQAGVHAMAAEALARAAVGLVVRSLEDVRDAQLGADLLHLPGDVQAHLLGLGHAGAGDQEDRLVEADFETAEIHASLLGAAACLCAIAAFT